MTVIASLINQKRFGVTLFANRQQIICHVLSFLPLWDIVCQRCFIWGCGQRRNYDCSCISVWQIICIWIITVDVLVFEGTKPIFLFKFRDCFRALPWCQTTIPISLLHWGFMFCYWFVIDFPWIFLFLFFACRTSVRWPKRGRTAPTCSSWRCSRCSVAWTRTRPEWSSSTLPSPVRFCFRLKRRSRKWCCCGGTCQTHLSFFLSSVKVEMKGPHDYSSPADWPLMMVRDNKQTFNADR